jgi:tetratricopeptide (TPR) repeat protein
MPDPLLAEVERRFTAGEDFLDEDEREEEALAEFQAAWDLLPEPKADHDLGLQILAALADTHFYLGRWQECHTALQTAVKSYDGALENPFIRLRLGQSLLELGDEREAANWMAPAFWSEGAQLFEGEDPKYLAFLKAQLQPPPGGWPEGW